MFKAQSSKDLCLWGYKSLCPTTFETAEDSAAEGLVLTLLKKWIVNNLLGCYIRLALCWNVEYKSKAEGMEPQYDMLSWDVNNLGCKTTGFKKQTSS